MNDNLFRILAAIIFVIGVAISIYHRHKADQEGGRVSLKEEGPLIMIALRVSGLGMWAGLFAWILNPAWMAWSRIDLPEWARWLGVGLGVLFDGLTWWVFATLKNNVTPTVVTRANAQLVTNGPYRWVRHPLYVIGMIGFAGFALLAENWFILLISALGFLALVVRADREEARLIEKFGDAYRQYMRLTGRFFPKFRSE
jgi:protein-S-isoprenylcysteine O-methyltransferase Ste14